MLGEVLSPILFNMYVDDFETNCLKSGSIPYEPSTLSLFLLMYDEDMVLFSESIEGLQSLLNELLNYCEAWKLSINVEKSKVLVFRKGGKSKIGAICHIGEHVLEIVDQFTY